MNDDRTYGLFLRLKERLEQQHQESQHQLKQIAYSVQVIDTCMVTLTILAGCAWVAYLADALGWT